MSGALAGAFIFGLSKWTEIATHLSLSHTHTHTRERKRERERVRNKRAPYHQPAFGNKRPSNGPKVSGVDAAIFFRFSFHRRVQKRTRRRRRRRRRRGQQQRKTKRENTPQFPCKNFFLAKRTFCRIAGRFQCAIVKGPLLRFYRVFTEFP